MNEVEETTAEKKKTISDEILEKYALSPTVPGVYLMKGKKGRIIYVGKARNLKKRLASYFVRESGHDLKTGLLVKNIEDFEVIVTATEHDALILESTLIKKHAPKYNVILKDGKNYPCFRIDTTKDYPVLQVVRKIKKDKATYFGPYSSAFSVKKTLKQVNRIFKLRKCRDSQFKNRSRPCLQYQIKACLGPCCYDISRERYHKIVNDVVLFLKGRTPDLIKRLKDEMMVEAEAQRFEQAAQIRDTLFAIEKTLERQIVVATDMMDRDVIACAGKEGRAVVMVLFVRSGYVVGTRHNTFDMALGDRAEVLSAFMKQYYQTSTFIPPQILVTEPFEDMMLLEEQLTLEKGRRIHIRIPERGEKRKIVEMALQNAESELETVIARSNETGEILKMLQQLLKMDRLPRRIECFDNSNISGTDPVSSMVVFIDGISEKSLYRKFIIKGVKEHDDYAYMTEVLTRRFRHAGDHDQGDGNIDPSHGGEKDVDDLMNGQQGIEDPMALPDLLVVDGGKGQLSMAISVLSDLRLLDKVPVVGLAKKDVMKGEPHDKIYIPNRSNPLNTSQSLKALYLLQQLRDEAHRFAITFQRKRREKRGEISVLDDISGIGKKRKAQLLTHFKGITAMKKADLDALAAVPGMTKKAAEAVYNAFHRK